jgi:hypothetical protein
MVGRVTAWGGISRCGAAARRGRTRLDLAVAQSGSAGAGWRKELTSGAHASARGEREGAENGRCESKKKTSFAKYAKGTHGPSGLGRPAGQGRRSGRAIWAGKEKKREIH